MLSLVVEISMLLSLLMLIQSSSIWGYNTITILRRGRRGHHHCSARSSASTGDTDALFLHTKDHQQPEPNPTETDVERTTTTTTTTTTAHTNNDRRRFLGIVVGALLPFLPSPSPGGVLAAKAVVVESDSNNKVFTAGQALGIEASRKRFVSARESVNDLLANYDDIVKNGGGDNIRRYLGTVGTTSGLYGITKVLKELQDEANDIVEYTENMNDFDYSLRAADTAAYSANFVEHGSAKTTPAQLFNEAKYETQQMKKYLNNMANEINL